MFFLLLACSHPALSCPCSNQGNGWGGILALSAAAQNEYAAAVALTPALDDDAFPSFADVALSLKLLLAVDSASIALLPAMEADLGATGLVQWEVEDWCCTS